MMSVFNLVVDAPVTGPFVPFKVLPEIVSGPLVPEFPAAYERETRPIVLITTEIVSAKIKARRRRWTMAPHLSFSSQIEISLNKG